MDYGYRMTEETYLMLGLWPKSKVSSFLLGLSDLAGFSTPHLTSESLLVNRMVETLFKCTYHSWGGAVRLGGPPGCSLSGWWGVYCGVWGCR